MRPLMRKPSAGAVLQERAVLSAYFHRLFLNEFSRGFAKKGEKKGHCRRKHVCTGLFSFLRSQLKASDNLALHRKTAFYRNWVKFQIIAYDCKRKFESIWSIWSIWSFDWVYFSSFPNSKVQCDILPLSRASAKRDLSEKSEVVLPRKARLPSLAGKIRNCETRFRIFFPFQLYGTRKFK